MTLPLPPPATLTSTQVRVRGKIANVGAAGAWLVIVVLIAANLVLSPTDPFPSWLNTVAGAAFAVSCLLWIVCVLEFFRERPAERSLVYGFLLMTGPVVGPLIFYYRIWKPRRRNGTQRDS